MPEEYCMSAGSRPGLDTTRREREIASRATKLRRELNFLENLPEEPEVEPDGEVYVLLVRRPLNPRARSHADVMVIGTRKGDSPTRWTYLNHESYQGAEPSWLDLVSYAGEGYSLQIWLVTEMVQIYAQDEPSEVEEQPVSDSSSDEVEDPFDD